MTDFISLTIVRGRDGGLSVHETSENNDQALVFAGNTKEVTEYFGSRATSLASGKDAQSKSTDSVRELPRRAVSSRSLADNLVSLDAE